MPVCYKLNATNTTFCLSLILIYYLGFRHEICKQTLLSKFSLLSHKLWWLNTSLGLGYSFFHFQEFGQHGTCWRHIPRVKNKNSFKTMLSTAYSNSAWNISDTNYLLQLLSRSFLISLHGSLDMTKAIMVILKRNLCHFIPF